jgi:PAS domain S-box-containing protein
MMKNIIIVDDRLENRYMLESLLKGVGYNIRTAKNGVEALSLARLLNPDLIISDILMPVMDGFTLCKEWRKDEVFKKIPFIFYTAAYTRHEDINYALRLGADRFLIKPIEPAEFLSIINNVLVESGKGIVKMAPESDKSEAENLKEYNAVLFGKLEDKLLQVEASEIKLKQYASKLEQNIGKLKHSEEKLRQTRDYLNNLINYANTPIIVWNPDHKITRFNHAFERLTGYSAGEVHNKKLDLLFPEKTKQEALSKIVKTSVSEDYESVEIPILTKNNEVRHILWNSASIYDKEGKNPISTIAQGQDITSRKQAEEGLKASESKLRDLNATKDKLFSIIAHDLKTPFNGIVGFSNILKEEIDDLDTAAIHEYADMINRAALQAFRLLDNLLNWARVQQGHLSCNPAIWSLKEVANDVIACLKESAGNKKITLTNNIPDKLMVTADGDMLQTIMRNLVSNAIKFTYANGKIELDAFEENAQVEILVKDNGKGINPGKLSRLFDVDPNISTRGTAGEDGTGLGLMLIKEFVEKHSGNIWAESEVGKGSRFHFTLPSYKPDEKLSYRRRSTRRFEHNINRRA